MSVCHADNGYNGMLGARISSIFVIMVGSFFGAGFPVFARRQALGLPEWAFFIAKYFGSGVIIATAFIHLLSPANDALGDPCLGGVWADYPWVEGIALIIVFVMFIVELMCMRYAKFGPDEHDLELVDRRRSSLPTNIMSFSDTKGDHSHVSSVPGEDHLGHDREHVPNEVVDPDWQNRGIIPESYSAQLTAIMILEFGIIFHSVFVGLTLAVAGSEFVTLYIVLVFHQTFEGLGLGSRLASIPWPKTKKWTPYMFATAYGFTTPIAIAIGLGIRTTYAPGSRNALIINGIFDSISAGILLYTGLVELMAHEFMFSPEMSKAPIRVVLAAFGLMVLGAGLMALLGRWA